MAVPAVRITNVAGDTFLDWICADITGNLLLEGSCDWLRQGEALAGQITLSIVPGTLNIPARTATIKTHADHATHPRSYPTDDTFPGVLLDGTTPYTGIVNDTKLVFNDAAVVTPAESWTSKVVYGRFVGSFEDGNPDGSPPGTWVDQARLGIKNTSGTLKGQVAVKISKPSVDLWRKGGAGLLGSVRCANALAVELVAPGTLQTLPYKFSAANLNTGANTIDLLIDASTTGTPAPSSAYTAIRISDNVTMGNLVGLTRGQSYRLTSGGPNGIEFPILAGAGNADSCNVTVQDRRAIQLAPDLSGSPGTFATADVVIGDLAPGALAFFWYRINANLGSGEKNPFQLPIYTSYLNLGVTAREAA